jgi:hypothetical protein
MISEGVFFCPAALSRAQLAPWISRIDQRYRDIEAARRAGDSLALGRLVPPDQKFVPTASSLTIGTVSSDEDLQTLFSLIDNGRAGEWLKLGQEIACDVDQAWVRRQYSPRCYPALHAPHGWHQDGALGFDFLAHSDGNFPPDALLQMVTYWIALGPCGIEAPGLEIVTRPPGRLLSPGELTDGRVQTLFGPEEFYRPVMEAGDAVLMRGDILHRTFVTPEMTHDRTSIELRFFATNALPGRLKGDRFLCFRRQQDGLEAVPGR